MKMTLRRALMLALLTLPLIMVMVLGYLSYTNALQIVDDLSTSVIQQTTERVRSEVESLLNRASLLSYSNQDFIQRKRPDHDRLAADFRRQMLQHAGFSYLSYSRVDGSYMHVHRRADNTFEYLSIKDGQKQYSKWQDGVWEPTGPSTETTNDARQRPYFKAAVAAEKQTWTDVYLFGYPPNERHPGLTCATPVYDESGKLRGVLTVDFELSALSRYLSKLQLFESGVAFVLDEDQILAHPDSRQVVKAEDNNGTLEYSLLLSKDVPSQELKDFLAATHKPTRSKLAEFEWRTNNVDYLGFTEPLSDIHDFNWSVAIMVPRIELTGAAEEHVQLVAWVAIASLATLIIVGVILARSIAKPLRRLTEEVGQIGQFQIDAKPLPETWLWEVERLSNATEEMKTGLRSFGKYVPIELVRSVLASRQEAELGGEERELTVFFSDIRGFTTIAEKLSPTDLVDLLGEYLGAMTEEIVAANGTVDKYIGDAIMAFWGAPTPNPYHAADACDAALRNIHRLQELQQHWRSSQQPLIDCRIGLNSGPLIVGNIGSKERLNYTVIGDTVNVAARLESLNKFYGTHVLLSESTATQVTEDFIARPIERVAVKGKSEGVLVYELLCRSTLASDAQKRLVELSHKAVNYISCRDFRRAAAEYQAIDALRRGDPATLRALKMCTEYIDSPPAGNWSAVRVMDSK